MATPKKAIKGKKGRPSAWKDEYLEQSYKLALLGLTDTQMADVFGVSEQTFNTWKKIHPGFLESLKRGKQTADANVGQRLYERAMGFEHDSEEIKVVSDGIGMGSSIVRVPIRKVYAPDTVAAIFWLKNRQPKLWRDKVETGFTDSEGKDRPIDTLRPSGTLTFHIVDQTSDSTIEPSADADSNMP